MALQSVTTTTTVSTVPAGTKIAADALAGGELVQYMKLVDGTPDSEAIIPGDATNGLWVNVKAAVAIPVTGTFFQATQPVSIASTVTVDTELVTADLDTGGGTDTKPVVGLLYGESGGARVVSSTNPLPIIGSVTAVTSGTATVTGSVSVSGSVDTELTTADLDTGGGTDTRAVVGLVYAASGGGVLVSVANPLPVTAVGGSSGTEYTEGDVDTTITGRALLWEDTGDTLRAASAAKPLPVTVISGGTAGTQYTEDAAAAADPVATALNLIRKDTLAAITDADGDNVAARGTNKGELYVKHVDAIPITDNGGSVTVDNGGTFAVQADTELTTADLDTGAGTDTRAVVGLVYAASGGAVLVSAANPLPVTGGGGTQYTEDVAATADPVGTALNLIRKDTLAAVTDADGDNLAARGTNKGELYVKHVDAIPVTDNGGSLTIDATSLPLPTGAATEATLSTFSTNTGNQLGLTIDALNDIAFALKTDDNAYTPATNFVMTAGFWAKDSSPDSVDEGDAGIARMSLNRNQYIQIRDGAGNERGAAVTAGNALQVAEVGAALTSLQLIDNLVLLEDDAAVGGDAGIQVLAVRQATPTSRAGSGDWHSLEVDANGALWVNAGTAANSFAKAEDGASADGDTGVPAMAIRKATPANTSGTDGDYEMLQVSGGKLWVQGTQTEDAGHTSGDVGVMALAVRRDTLAAGAGTDLDYEALQTNPNGQLRVEAGGKTTRITANPTLTVAATYVSGDYVGTSATPWTWANAVRISGGTGILESVVLVDKALQSVACELWLFDRTLTVPNDSAAWNLSDADALNCIGIIDLSSYRASTLNSVCTVSGLGLAFKCNGTDLFGALVTRGAPAYATGDLLIALTILQD